MSGITYELRVDHSDGYDIAKIDAATIEEAVQRADRIWPGTTSVQLLCMVDRKPQTCLAFP